MKDQKDFENQILESEKALGQIHGELAKDGVKSEETRKHELEIEGKGMEEKISFLQSKIREAERAACEPELRRLLLKLRDDRSDEEGRFRILKEIAKNTLATRNLMGFRIAYDRIEMTKCLITDEKWRARVLPQRSQSLITPMGKKPNEGFGVDPIFSGNPIYQTFPYKKALQLQKGNMVKILDNGGPPQFEARYIYDQEPEILKDLARVDFGPILLIDGQPSSAMQKLWKEFGPAFRFNLEYAEKLLAEK